MMEIIVNQCQYEIGDWPYVMHAVVYLRDDMDYLSVIHTLLE